MIALELPPFWYAAAMQAGLAFIAGFLEIVGLIALFGLFIGHITANIALLGMAIATDVPGTGTKLVALPIFIAVVALTGVGVHLLRLRGYDAARLIMALELALRYCHRNSYQTRESRKLQLGLRRRSQPATSGARRL